jgi:uncharacterized membrane protein YdjX (TVP38/TMEM64 family)
LEREQSHEHVIWLQSKADHALLIQMKKEQEKMSGNVAEAGIARPTGVAANLKRWAPLVILLGGIAAVYASGLHKYLSLTAIADNRDALMAYVADNSVLAAAAYVAIYVAAVAFSLPGAALLTILGGFLFGWLLGGVFTVVAATAGAVAIFLAAKTSLGDTLASRAGPWMEKLSGGFREDAFNYMLFLRLVPVFPFWLVNIAPAIAGVGLGTYALTTLIGIIPGTFAFSVLGSGLDSIITEQRAAYQSCIAENGEANCEFALDAGALVTPQLLVAFAALGVVALIPVVVKKLRARKNATSGDA